MNHSQMSMPSGGGDGNTRALVISDGLSDCLGYMLALLPSSSQLCCRRIERKAAEEQERNMRPVATDHTVYGLRDRSPIAVWTDRRQSQEEAGQ